MKLISIAAIAENNTIGKNNDLVWHLPDDFKRFKSLTSGHYIILGRKTFESFPKPLPHRTHVIITRQEHYQAPGHLVVSGLNEAIAAIPKNENKAFVIGGGEIYKQAMSRVDQLEITHVHTTVEGDAFFPEIDQKQWKVIEETYHPKDERHQYDFTYKTYVRSV
ncbi:dihydrofolate reductase [Psychroflexus sp. ALD_RP9]|uniref:dihydrofolate reductase n=1 Tax=Psychroflexus sp. ALD_RP9 TaxID=2777186 RepID=UPI001A901765|nr:dihydrofolate reductase [Psychroflexus sp. ALD_RP9]QSS98297.1 dihydrofolate reductase [Psychroflexus sp. ALD_RP9]